MAENKGWGDTVLGWFYEREGSGDRKEKEGSQAEAEPAPPPPPPVELKGDLPLPAQPGAPLEFPAIYRVAGIEEQAQDRVEKAITLLGTLPADASKQVRRQIVEASLKAFGYPVEQILEAARAEIGALQAFVQFGERNTKKLEAEAAVRIEALNQEIAALQAATREKIDAQAQLASQCSQQQLRIKDVLEFFETSPAAEPPAPE